MIALAIAGFWIGLLVPAAAYIGYPFAVRLAARMRPDPVMDREDGWPSVTIVVAAHNEEATIERTVRCLLEQSYPGGEPEVIVGLDGCTDGTRAAVERLGSDRVSYLDLPRAGKATTANRLAAAAASSVIVTTDAGSEFIPGALERLCDPFRDPTVGCTTGVFVPRVEGSQPAASEGLYWRFEQALMAAESRLGILACASGTVMAYRRTLFRPIPLDSDGDVWIAPAILIQGSRVVFVPEAVVHDEGPRTLGSVLRNRRRMALRALPATLRLIPRLMRAGAMAATAGLLMHKVLRWLSPFFAALWLAAAVVLIVSGAGAYPIISLALLVAGASIVGLAISRGPSARSAVAGLLLAQLAFALATADALRGRRASMWEG